MLRPVDRGGQQPVEGMHPQLVGEEVLRLLESQEIAVDRILRHAVGLALAVAEGRILGQIDRRQLDRRPPVEPIGVRRVILHAQIALEQADDAVDRPLVAAAGDEERSAAGLQPVAVLGQSGRVARIQHDVAPPGRCAVHDRKPRPARLLDEALQQPGGCPVDGSFAHHHDTRLRLAVTRHGNLRLGAERSPQQHEETDR